MVKIVDFCPVARVPQNPAHPPHLHGHRAWFWSGELQPFLLNLLQQFPVLHPGVGATPQGHDLPQHHPIAPHVRLGGEDEVHEGLQGHPLGGEGAGLRTLRLVHL